MRNRTVYIQKIKTTKYIGVITEKHSHIVWKPCMDISCKRGWEKSGVLNTLHSEKNGS